METEAQSSSVTHGGVSKLRRVAKILLFWTHGLSSIPGSSWIGDWSWGWEEQRPISARPWDLPWVGISVTESRFWNPATLSGWSLISLSLSFLFDKMEKVKLALQGAVRWCQQRAWHGRCWQVQPAPSACLTLCTCPEGVVILGLATYLLQQQWGLAVICSSSWCWLRDSWRAHRTNSPKGKKMASEFITSFFFKLHLSMLYTFAPGNVGSRSSSFRRWVNGRTEKMTSCPGSPDASLRKFRVEWSHFPPGLLQTDFCLVLSSFVLCREEAIQLKL